MRLLWRGNGTTGRVRDCPEHHPHRRVFGCYSRSGSCRLFVSTSVAASIAVAPVATYRNNVVGIDVSSHGVLHLYVLAALACSGPRGAGQAGRPAPLGVRPMTVTAAFLMS